MSSALENIKSIDLEQWLTLNTASSPTKLTPGQTPDMQNVWTDEKPGSIITAPGYVKVGTVPSNNPCSFCIDYFKLSSGLQTFVVSDNESVWTTVDFQNFTQIITGLTFSFQLRGAVIRDKLWLTNGSDPVQVFDGITVTPLSNSGGIIEITIQDIEYTYNQNSGVSPSAINIAYVPGAVAGSEVVTVVNQSISVQIQSGVSTATQVLAAINASAAALVLITPTITGIASSPQTSPAQGTMPSMAPNAPRGRYIAYHDERVWLYHVSENRSAVYFSSLTDAAANIINPDDFTAWDTADNFLQISEGDADFGTGMLLYRGYLNFFKQYSIWRLVGYDEYTYSRVKTRSSTGTRFNESIQELDSLVHFIGIDGIYVFDGEESDRISDLIDPSTASQTAFGFNQIQQPIQNNQFWEVLSTQDWNEGNIPSNLEVDNGISLIPSDNSQSDFEAGPTQTNIDLLSNPGFIQLSNNVLGVSAPNIAANRPVTITPPSGGSTVGVGSQITDGDLASVCGWSTNNGNSGSLTISLPNNISTGLPINQITIYNLHPAASIKFTDANGLQIFPLSISSPSGNWAIVSGGLISGGPTTDTVTIQFNGTPPLFQTTSLTISGTPIFLCTEVQVFSALYFTSGQFISKPLNLGLAPASLGNFNATETLNGESTSYFTQSSPDGFSWDAAVPVPNGGVIGSVLRQFLRWGVNITSDGINTPAIQAVYLPSAYLSEVHNTLGSIFAWGPLEASLMASGQRVNFFYRTAIIAANIATTTWASIVPGGAISYPISNQYIQFKIEISGGNASNLPSVSSVTINWVVGVVGQTQTLQNVASFSWINRYWLSAAKKGSTANNVIVIRGKKTFQNPWMLKDWNILSFTRYQDNFYGCSSLDGSIYRLDTGYSKDTLAMDSYFETGDFVFNGFTANLIEIDVEVERSGTYPLAVGVSLDNGNTWQEIQVDLSPSTFDDNYMKRLNFNMTATRFRLRFRTNGMDTPFQVHRAIAYYSVGAERGSIRGDYQPS